MHELTLNEFQYQVGITFTVFHNGFSSLRIPVNRRVNVAVDEARQQILSCAVNHDSASRNGCTIAGLDTYNLSAPIESCAAASLETAAKIIAAMKQRRTARAASQCGRRIAARIDAVII
jgi:hypothetical protein